MAFRFVHTADIHLDSPLRSLALRDPALAELIGNATRRSFVSIVDLCLAEEVDALLIAGDLYDGEQTSMKTARFLAGQFRRLDQARISVFVVRGNHDALSRITRELVLPDAVHVFPGRAEAVPLQRSGSGPDIVVHGISFAQPQARESLVSRFRPPIADAINIGMLHTSLAGAPGHDSYAPCSLTELEEAGFSYWALGHIHKRKVHDCRCAVVMPGIPQGRDVNESGPKSVTLVTIADDGTIALEERETCIAQFERLRIDLGGIESRRELSARMEDALGRAREAARAEHLVVRLSLEGTTRLAWQLRRDPDLLRAEADERACTLDGCWIEKIETACRLPVDPVAPISADPIMELRQLMSDGTLSSPAFQADIAGIIDELRLQLPSECRHILGHDAMSEAELIRQLVKEGGEDILARLPSAHDAPAH